MELFGRFLLWLLSKKHQQPQINAVASLLVVSVEKTGQVQSQLSDALGFSLLVFLLMID